MNKKVSSADDNLSLPIALNIWAKQQGNHIHIHLAGSGIHKTVTDNPDSKRYHRTLFRDLRSILTKHGKWPFDDEDTKSKPPI